MEPVEMLRQFMFDYNLTLKKTGVALGGYSEGNVSRWRAGLIKIPPAVLLLMRLVYDGKIQVVIEDDNRYD